MHRQLQESLYREHLEEISFLYGQREQWLDDPEVSLAEIAVLEDRLEAHVDALVVGDDHALRLCQAWISEADFGELHGAIRVFCRQQRLDLVRAALEQASLDDDEVSKGVGDALKQELPSAWRDELGAVVLDAPPDEVPLWADAIGYKRMHVLADVVLQAAMRKDLEAAPLTWALGRLRPKDGRMFLYRYLQHPDPDVSRDAAIALLRYGEPSVIKDLRRFALDRPWLAIPISVSSGPAALASLRENLKQTNDKDDAALALGLLGDTAALDTLLQCLSDPEVSGSAAIALYLATGAPLVREAFTPDAEGGDDDLPAAPEEATEPRGTIVRAIENDADAWRSWINENADLFRKNVRYRLGRPAALERCMHDLANDLLPRRIRGFLGEDYTLRYGVDLGYEPDQSVVAQMAALKKAAVSPESGRMTEGRWYFAGRPIA